MTHEELKTALRTKTTVMWRGKTDYEKVIGSITAIIYRHLHGQSSISAELTSYGCPRSVVICSPEDLEYWSPIAECKETKDGEDKNEPY